MQREQKRLEKLAKKEKKETSNKQQTLLTPQKKTDEKVNPEIVKTTTTNHQTDNASSIEYKESPTNFENKPEPAKEDEKKGMTLNYFFKKI